MTNPAVDTAPGDVTAPSAPTFTITPYGKGVMLTITLAEPSDFAYYEVHKGLSAGAMSLFAQGRSTQVPDTAAAYGTAYFYKVRAVDTSGNASAFSATLSTTPATWATADVTVNAVTQSVYHAEVGVSQTTTSTSFVAFTNGNVTINVSSSASILLVVVMGDLTFWQTSAATGYCGASLGCRIAGADVALTNRAEVHAAPQFAVTTMPAALVFMDAGRSGNTVYQAIFKALSTGTSVNAQLNNPSIQVTELKR